MKRLASFITTLMVCASLLTAQDQTSNSSSHSKNSIAAFAQAQQDQSPDQNDKEKSKKEKRKKKDKEDVDGVTSPATFSDAVAQTVLQQLTDGLEGHSDRRMLAAFDEDKMEGYLNFQHQITALFQRYNSFRIHFRISQATTEESRGIVLADIEMEKIPQSATEQPIRKRDQIRFEMERGKKGWKIVDLRPRSFFT